MSLLLDALKRAERQKRIESAGDELVVPISALAAVSAELPVGGLVSSPSALPGLELAEVGAEILPPTGKEEEVVSPIADFPSLSFSLEPMASIEQPGLSVAVPESEKADNVLPAVDAETFPALSMAVSEDSVVDLPLSPAVPEMQNHAGTSLDVDFPPITELGTAPEPVFVAEVAAKNEPFSAVAAKQPDSVGTVAPIVEPRLVEVAIVGDPAVPAAGQDAGLQRPEAPVVAAELTSSIPEPVLAETEAERGASAPAAIVEPVSKLTDEEKRERAERIKQSWSAAMSPTRKRRLVLGGVVVASALASVAALFVMNAQGGGGASLAMSPGTEAKVILAEAGDVAKEVVAAASLPPKMPATEGDGVPIVPPNQAVAVPVVAVPGVPVTPVSAASSQTVPAKVAEPVVQVPVAPRLPPPAQEPAIQRDQIVVRVHPATEAGFKAMNSGEVEAARQHYREALRSDQTNRDALLGLAVAALREGRPDEAASWYERMLMLDPRDTDATAGLALVRGQLDPVAYEGRLRNLLLERGETASLHYSLGILLARQNRWGEAQESFFRAITLAPASPDYHFNLAVALDHLSQYKQAAIYYQKALSLASGIQHPGFSVSAARQRIAAISSM